MTRLNELINELCPDGVEYNTLGEVTEMQRGTSLTKINSNLGEYPVISGGREPAFYCDLFNRENETITVAGSGAGAGYVQYWNQKIFVCDAFSIKGNKNLLTKYIYYCLENLQEEIYATKKGGGVPHVHISSISNFKIPVPPLPVQEEIVRILDKFTSLEAELEAELEARRVQYEYYRDELLTAKTHKTEKVFLEDIAEYSKERIPASEVNADSYVGVDNLLQNRQGKEVSIHIPKDGNLTKYYPKDILIGNIRPYLKKIWFADNMGGTNGDVLVIHPTSEKIIPRYLYFNLSSDRFFDYDNSKAKGAKMPRGDKEVIMKYKLTLPSLEVQKRIVNVLDNFDAICSDLKIGLPAEIDARKKQYEYYRDLLLTFAERGNTILTEQNRTEQNRTEQNRTEQNRTDEIKLLQYVFGCFVLFDKLRDRKRIRLVNLSNQPVGKNAVVQSAGNAVIEMDRNAVIEPAEMTVADEFITLKDLFNTRNGYTPSTSNSEYWENGTIPWFMMDDIRKNGRILSDSSQHITRSAVKKSGLFPANSIIVATSATIGEHALITTDFLCNQRFTCLSLKDEFKDRVNMKYIFYYAFKLDEFCKANTTKSSFASVDMTKFYDFKFWLPSLAEQERIVKILDRFESLCNDISAGLPAEIKMRKKQYEFYRDKLLAFKEKS